MNHCREVLIASAVAALLTTSANAISGEPGGSVAAGPAVEMPDFSLLDLGGHNRELHRAGGRAVVLFFTGTGCPIARKSAPKLLALKDQFQDKGVSVWVVNSYADDTLEDVRSFIAGVALISLIPLLRKLIQNSPSQTQQAAEEASTSLRS
jgi:hypothetical protein